MSLCRCLNFKFDFTLFQSSYYTHTHTSAYASVMASTLSIPFEQDFVDGLPWCPAVTGLLFWKALRVQYSLQYQGGSFSRDVWLLSQHPESPSAGLPGCELRVRFWSELPGANGGAMVLTAYGMPRRQVSQPGMLLYVLPSMNWWRNWGWHSSSCTSAHLISVSIWSVSSVFSMFAVFSCVTTQLCNRSHI